MWKFNPAGVLALALTLTLMTGPLAAYQPSPDSSPLFDRVEPAPQYDRNTLRDQVEETEPLVDGLARETRGLSKGAKQALFKSLDMDFNLGGQVSAARKSLDLGEAILDIQDGIRSTQAHMKQEGDASPTMDKDERRLLGLQNDLITTVAALRAQLSDQQRDMNEPTTRDLRGWYMVSEGLLRHHREDAEAAAKAHPTPEAPPIDAAAVSPSAGAVVLSPSAGAGR